jgi:NitT/TauT family transport system ATP-binding protein
MLLLDEPFSALDAFTRAALQKDVRLIAKNLGINLVIVTHSIDEAVLMADRAVIMAGSPGQIEEEIVVSLPEERNAQDPEVQKIRGHLMETFRRVSSVENK